MAERRFNMRLRSTYKGNENLLDDLFVEHTTEHGWAPLELNLKSPGFEIFIYSLLTCQQLYFRTNCAERGLVLAAAEGSVSLSTDSNWQLLSSRVDFCGKLRSGEPTPEVRDYIAARMRQCPVSRNLREPGEMRIFLDFE